MRQTRKRISINTFSYISQFQMNISQLLQEIYEAGFTDEEIGSRIGASQSIVFRLRTGVHKSTGYERGNRIQQLHGELVGNVDGVSEVKETTHG